MRKKMVIYKLKDVDSNQTMIVEIKENEDINSVIVKLKEEFGIDYSEIVEKTTIENDEDA